MTFQIAGADLLGNIDSGTIATLSPGPSYVEYPPFFDQKGMVQSDQRVVVQGPLRDSRERKWVWEGYRHNILSYDTWYNQILNLQYDLRENAGLHANVFLKEDVSLGLFKLVQSGTVWLREAFFVKAKVTDVSRQVSNEGGHTKYDTTSFTFIIDDLTWNVF